MTRRTGQRLLRLLLTLIALGLISFHVLRAEDLLATIKGIRLPFLFLAVGLLAMNIGVQYHKWLYILRVVDPGFSRFRAFLSLISGFTLGFITPGRLGELGRGFFLTGVDRKQVTGLALLDKTMNNLAIAFFGCLGFYYLFKYPFQLPIYVLIPIAGLMILSGIFFGYLIWNPSRWLPIYLKFIERLRWLKAYRELFACVRYFGRREFLKIFRLSLLFYAVVFLQFYLLLLAFGDQAVVPALAAIAAALFSKTLLPISIGDLGVREGASVYFLHQVGVAKAHAFEASLLLFVINLLLPSLLGLPFFHRFNLWNNNKRK